MQFNSWQFLLFFPAVVTLYFALPHRMRWALLLAASYFFYACWNPAYLLLIVTSTLIDYLAGLAMGRAGSRRRRRKYLVLSLLTNLGLLFSFKYFNFLNRSLRAALAALGVSIDLPELNVLLPVGISFYTFQTLSYTIEVYRGRREPERHPGIFALYVSFFPQLVAGPIERAGNLLPQLRLRQRFDYDRVAEGLRLMAWGMFKKVAIADRLALIVDRVYGDPTGFEGPHLVLGTVFFAFQIYCDFSGYSDIAIGAARVMGVRLMRNFNRPYLAASIADFWRRWHISLTTWFRDYVYIPLGGNRTGRGRWRFNVAVVFLVSGMWHGANWTFLVWGALHGTFFLLEHATRNVRAKLAAVSPFASRPRLRRAAGVAATFLAVTFAWIFFRAESVSDAFHVVGHLGAGWRSLLGAGGLRNAMEALDLPSRHVWWSLALIGLLVAVQFTHGRTGPTRLAARQPVWVRWPVYAAIVLGILNLGIAEEIPFYYFQF